MSLANNTRCYDPGELEEALDAFGVDDPGTRNGYASSGHHLGFDLHPEMEPPMAKLKVLFDLDAELEALWNRRRKLPSQSEYDLALASRLASVDFSDEEIVSVLVAHRARGGGKPKLREDYYARTLAKARAHTSRPGKHEQPGAETTESRTAHETTSAAYKPFPVEDLPEPVSSFVRACSEAIGCDPAFVALPLISALTAAIGNTFRIRLKRGWTEPAIVWTVAIGESGTQKSPAWDPPLEPIRKLQRRALKEFEEESEDYERLLQVYERDLRIWKSGRSSADPPEKPEKPVAVRYYTSDTTIEALAINLRDQPRGMLMASEELAGWIRGFNQYKGGLGSDVAHWLEMHGGRTMLIDRKSGDPKIIHVPRAAVSVAGGIQPDTLRKCLGEEHFENGMAARLLFAYPPRRQKRWTEAELSPRHEEALQKLFDELCALESRETDEGEPEPNIVGLTPEAKQAWIEFYNEQAAEQASLSGDLAAAWSKLEGYAARLALVVHVVRCVTGGHPTTDPVDDRSVAAGIGLSRWFGNEARRVYLILGEKPEGRERRNQTEAIRARGGRVTVREWHRARSHDSADDARKELQALVDAGLGRFEPSKPGPKGGRPSEVFVLHDEHDTSAPETPPDGV
jgi:hypothetical protein